MFKQEEEETVFALNKQCEGLTEKVVDTYHKLDKAKKKASRLELEIQMMKRMLKQEEDFEFPDFDSLERPFKVQQQ